MGKYKISSRKELIIIIVIVFLITIFASIISILINYEKEKEEATVSSTVLKTVEEVLTYYGCTYIKEKDSKEEDYEIDVYLIFRSALYENDKSNEEFFNTIIKSIAKVLYYENFRMIDDENNIKIEVICEQNKVSKIIVNSMEDYFIYMDSQISQKDYKVIKDSELTVDSNELIDVINNNWSGDSNFGTRESIFKNYFIYFDEGIEVRKIDSKIYNIVFTAQYENPVINGLKVGLDFNEIQKSLGTAQFKGENNEFIGYKSKDVYVFFTRNQISVYRNEIYKYDEFLNLVDDFLDETIDLMEFMNELTYLWPDYSEYIYDTDYFFISYPLKGIDIKYNYENISGIVVYNNFNLTQSKIKDYLENTEFVSRLQIDNVCEAEARRHFEINNLLTKCRNFISESKTEENIIENDNFAYYMDLDDNGFVVSAYFISKNNEYANSELNENMHTYTWAQNNYFIYSIKNKGIFYYDVVTRIKGKILEGSSEYKIMKYEDGILKYDDSELLIEF